MTKKILMAAVCAAFLLTGCAKETGTDQTDAAQTEETTTAAQAEAEENLQTLMAKETAAEETDTDALREKYAEWFDADGNIVYPVSIDSEEYQQTETLEEMYDLLRMPQEIVDSISTEALLQAVENHPLLSTTYSLYNSYEEGLSYMAQQFYAMEALLSREDVGLAAAQSYLSRTVDSGLSEAADAEAVYGQILLEEYLIAQQETYEKLSEEERSEVMEKIQENYEAEQELAAALPSVSYHFYDMVESAQSAWAKVI